MKLFGKNKKESFNKSTAELLDSAFKNEGFTRMGEFSNEDIFIVSFPKSGNTWMQNLVTSLIFGSTQGVSPKLVNEVVPDIHAKQYYKRLYDTMFFKSHALPQKEYRKVIYLVRDGRDVVVSYYHYNNLSGKKNNSLDSMLHKPNEMWPSSWHHHVDLWLNNPFDSELLVIRYEDMIADCEKEMERVARFANFDTSATDIASICKNNDLTSLRAKVAKSGWDYDKYFGNDSKNFFRKGIVGDYKNELTWEQIKAFEEYSADTLRKMNYDI